MQATNDCHMDVQYEPELFPGLIYRMKQPKVVLLIFVSGKVVLTGAPSVTDSSAGVLAMPGMPQAFQS